MLETRDKMRTTGKDTGVWNGGATALSFELRSRLILKILPDSGSGHKLDLMANSWRSSIRSVVVLVLAAAVLRAQTPPLIPPTPLAPSADSSHPVYPATLLGRVTGASGLPLAGAEITLLNTDKLHMITDDSGQFHITGLTPGTNIFNVRRLGYEPASFTAVLKSGKTHRATFSLTEAAHTLPTVAVSDTTRTTHWLDVFEARRSTHHGTFITREQIVKRGARTGTDIVRNVAGVRVQPFRGNAGYQVIMTRGAGGGGRGPCIPTMFYHNTPYSGTLDDFSADDIEALEVYIGISEIPPELDKNGKGICGAIVVWTRDPRKAP
jgi:hypothetical protein